MFLLLLSPQFWVHLHIWDSRNTPVLWSFVPQCWALWKHLSTVSVWEYANTQAWGESLARITSDISISKYSLCVLARTCTKPVQFQLVPVPQVQTGFESIHFHTAEKAVRESSLIALRQHLPLVYTSKTQLPLTSDTGDQLKISQD